MSPTLAVRVAHGAAPSGAGSVGDVCRLFWRHPVFRSPRSMRPPVVAALLALPLALTGCGGTSDADSDSAAGTSAAEESAWPVTVTGDNGELTLDAQPENIVSLSATATEMLFA